MDMVMVLWRAAGGMVKLGPMFRSMADPWWVKKVEGSWKMTAKMRSVAHVGISFRITLPRRSPEQVLFSGAGDFAPALQKSPRQSFRISGTLQCSHDLVKERVKLAREKCTFQVHCRRDIVREEKE